MNEAETVVTHLLGCTRTDLYLGDGAGFTPATCRQLSRILKRRIAGEPIQYIVGETEFMGLRFEVTPAVLIPRPETELVVETVVKSVVREQGTGNRLRILDVGTGSGCIAIALAKMLPHAAVDAVDVSGTALALARKNALLHGVTIHFLHKEVHAFDPGEGAYDYIVSNPPYVTAADIASLQPEVAHEPRIALDGGEDGCDAYRMLIPWALTHLREGGSLVLEIGCGQRTTVEDTIAKTHGFTIVEAVRDYAGIERILVFQKKTRKLQPEGIGANG